MKLSSCFVVFLVIATVVCLPYDGSSNVRIQQINQVIGQIQYGTPNHVNSLTNAVNRALAQHDSTPLTVVDVIIRATPSSVGSINSQFESAVASMGGACKTRFNQWTLLQQGKIYTQFYGACVSCDDDTSFATLANKPGFKLNVAAAKLAKIMKSDPIDDKDFQEVVQTRDIEEMTKRELLKSIPESNKNVETNSEENSFAERGPFDFSGNPAENCNMGSNYNWMMDALDGFIDCHMINGWNPNCRYVKNGGSLGTYFVIDTGTNQVHPELQYKFIDGSATFDSIPLDYHPATVDRVRDSSRIGHGLVIQSILVGKTLGITPQAKLVSMKVFNSSEYDETAYVTAVERVYTVYAAVRPKMIVTGTNLAYEKDVCEWIVGGTVSPTMISVCGVFAVAALQQAIINGVVYVSAAMNGYEVLSLSSAAGLDVCRWAAFLATEEGEITRAAFGRAGWPFEQNFFPTFTMQGDEVAGYQGIRPMRIGAYDQSFELNPWNETQTGHPAGMPWWYTMTINQMGSSNFGDWGWCLDYAAPGVKLNRIATQHPFFPSKYQDGVFKDSGTSWASAVGAAAMMSHLIENWDFLSTVPAWNVSQQLRVIIDDIVRDSANVIVKKTTSNVELSTQNGEFQWTLANMVFNGTANPNLAFDTYFGPGSDVAHVKNIMMAASAGKACYLVPPNRINYWPGKVSQHTEDLGLTWKTDSDGVSGSTLDKLTYCRKFWPQTTSIRENFMNEYIADWKAVYNTGSYQATMPSTECVLPVAIYRTSYWPGKVHQHVDVATRRWVTDASGANVGMTDLAYCRKFYRHTMFTRPYAIENIHNWRAAGNTKAYSAERPTLECVIPRIALWPGKVANHIDANTGIWMTDSDGVSGGGHQPGSPGELAYCKKFYPQTTSVRDYDVEYIDSFYTQGNQVRYSASLMTRECFW